jgi:hypothetical protein
MKEALRGLVGEEKVTIQITHDIRSLRKNERPISTIER